MEDAEAVVRDQRGLAVLDLAGIGDLRESESGPVRACKAHLSPEDID